VFGFRDICWTIFFHQFVNNISKLLIFIINLFSSFNMLDFFQILIPLKSICDTLSFLFKLMGSECSFARTILVVDFSQAIRCNNKSFGLWKSPPRTISSTFLDFFPRTKLRIFFDFSFHTEEFRGGLLYFRLHKLRIRLLTTRNFEIAVQKMYPEKRMT